MPAGAGPVWAPEQVAARHKPRSGLLESAARADRERISAEVRMAAESHMTPQFFATVPPSGRGGQAGRRRGPTRRVIGEYAFDQFCSACTVWSGVCVTGLVRPSRLVPS